MKPPEPLGQESSRPATIVFDISGAPAVRLPASNGVCDPHPKCVGVVAFRSPRRPPRRGEFEDLLAIVAALTGGWSGLLKLRQHDSFLSDAALADLGWTSLLKKRDRDAFTSNVSVIRAWVSPFRRRTRDGFFLDPGLDSGIVTLVITSHDAPDDLVEWDVTTDSGELVQRIFEETTASPEDSLLADVVLDEGLYMVLVLAIVAPPDHITSDITQDEGEYVLRIDGSTPHEDSMFLDAAMDSGAYG